MKDWADPSPPYIGKPRGRMGIQNTKITHEGNTFQGQKGKAKGHVELQGGAPHVAGHTPRGPPKGALIHPCHPKISWDKAQNNGFPKSNTKSTFTIHDDILQRPVELKIFMWA